jgi:hypothetical protein
MIGIGRNVRRAMFSFAAIASLASGTIPAWALGSTLVTVVNPSTNPALTSSINDPGRVPYQAFVDKTGACSGSFCIFDFPAVDAGHRVVIQHISGIVQFNTTPSDVTVFGSAGTSLAAHSIFFGPINGGSSAFDQPTLFFIDAGQGPQVEVLVGGASFIGGDATQHVSMTGYELDCTAAPCAPIAP